MVTKECCNIFCSQGNQQIWVMLIWCTYVTLCNMDDGKAIFSKEVFMAHGMHISYSQCLVLFDFAACTLTQCPAYFLHVACTSLYISVLCHTMHYVCGQTIL